MGEHNVGLLSTAAISAALVAALAFLLRSWISESLKNAISHEYATKLESLKAQLQADNAIALERLKADLQIASAERQVRFSKLHEKAAQSVEEVHSLLSDLMIAVSRYTSALEEPSMGTREERRLTMARAMDSFDVYFRRHQIYLPNALAERIREFNKAIHGNTMAFMFKVEQGDERYPDRDTWFEVDHAVRDEIQPLLESLRAEFRRMLGVEEHARVETE